MSTLARIAGALSPDKPLREARFAAWQLFHICVVIVAPALLGLIALFMSLEP